MIASSHQVFISSKVVVQVQGSSRLMKWPAKLECYVLNLSCVSQGVKWKHGCWAFWKMALILFGRVGPLLSMLRPAQHLILISCPRRVWCGRCLDESGYDGTDGEAVEEVAEADQGFLSRLDSDYVVADQQQCQCLIWRTTTIIIVRWVVVSLTYLKLTSPQSFWNCPS